MPQMPDPQTYIIKLRSNVRFHSGKAMTAADVKFTYDTLLKADYGAIWRSAVSSVLDSVTAQDANTIVFKLNKPFGPFLTKLSLIPIVNADQSKDDLAQKPDGTGPFRFVAYDKGSLIQMARHDAYHLSELKPKIGAVSIYVIPENSTRYAGARAHRSRSAQEPRRRDPVRARTGQHVRLHQLQAGGWPDDRQASPARAGVGHGSLGHRAEHLGWPGHTRPGVHAT